MLTSGYLPTWRSAVLRWPAKKLLSYAPRMVDRNLAPLICIS